MPMVPWRGVPRAVALTVLVAVLMAVFTAEPASAAAAAAGAGEPPAEELSPIEREWAMPFALARVKTARLRALVTSLRREMGEGDAAARGQKGMVKMDKRVAEAMRELSALRWSLKHIMEAPDLLSTCTTYFGSADGCPPPDASSEVLLALAPGRSRTATVADLFAKANKVPLNALSSPAEFAERCCSVGTVGIGMPTCESDFHGECPEGRKGDWKRPHPTKQTLTRCQCCLGSCDEDTGGSGFGDAGAQASADLATRYEHPKSYWRELDAALGITRTDTCLPFLATVPSGTRYRMPRLSMVRHVTEVLRSDAAEALSVAGAVDSDAGSLVAATASDSQGACLYDELGLDDSLAEDEKRIDVIAGHAGPLARRGMDRFHVIKATVKSGCLQYDKDYTMCSKIFSGVERVLANEMRKAYASAYEDIGPLERRKLADEARRISGGGSGSGKGEGEGEGEGEGDEDTTASSDDAASARANGRVRAKHSGAQDPPIPPAYALVNGQEGLQRRWGTKDEVTFVGGNNGHLFLLKEWEALDAVGVCTPTLGVDAEVLHAEYTDEERELSSAGHLRYGAHGSGAASAAAAAAASAAASSSSSSSSSSFSSSSPSSSSSFSSSSPSSSSASASTATVDNNDPAPLDDPTAPRIVISDSGVQYPIAMNDLSDGILALNASHFLIGAASLDHKINYGGEAGTHIIDIDVVRDCDVIDELLHGTRRTGAVDWSSDVGTGTSEPSAVEVPAGKSKAEIKLAARAKAELEAERRAAYKRNSTAVGQISPEMLAKLVVGTPYRRSHGTMVRSVAVRSSRHEREAVREAFYKFHVDASTDEMTIHDVAIAGPRATYSLGRTKQGVWQMVSARLGGEYRDHSLMASSLATALFLVRSCPRDTMQPIVLSNSWGNQRDESVLARRLKHVDMPAQGIALAEYYRSATRAVAMDGRGGLGCINVFAADNRGSNQVLATEGLYTTDAHVLVAVGYISRGGHRWSAVTNGVQLNPRSGTGRLALPSYGPNVGISAPVGFCHVEFDDPLRGGQGARIEEANGNSAAAPAIAAAAARVQAIVPNLPWNAVLDILITTASSDRFVIPESYDGSVSAPGAPTVLHSAVMLPKQIMGCTCRTRAMDWTRCDARTRRCRSLGLRHSIFSGYGSVDVPRAVEHAKALARTMRADRRVARALRGFYLAREAWPVAMVESRDPRDVAACTPEVANLSPIGHERVLAFVPAPPAAAGGSGGARLHHRQRVGVSGGAPVNAAAEDAAQSLPRGLMLEHVTVKGTHMRVVNVGGVSMWLERFVDGAGASRDAVRGSESVLMTPDVTRRESPEGVTLGSSSSIRYWGEWRMCIAGLSPIDIARWEASSSRRGEGEGVVLTFHGRQFDNYAVAEDDDEGEGDDAAKDRCECPVSAADKREAELSGTDSNVWPSDGSVSVAKVAVEAQAAAELKPTNAARA
jgi:hypothetical protein